MQHQQKADLSVAEVARIVGCHDNTVRQYEKKGFIKAFRDFNNFRRFTMGEALKLKEIFEIRER